MTKKATQLFQFFSDGSLCITVVIFSKSTDEDLAASLEMYCMLLTNDLMRIGLTLTLSSFGWIVEGNHQK
jgi:hypothetical protein